MDKLYLVLIVVISLVPLTNTAPAACRSCTGSCKNNEINNENGGNMTDTEFLDALVDNETGKLLNFTSAEMEELDESSGQRAKRDTFIEKRTCSSQFQLELFIIPIAIAMIPLALISLLLCVCFCGPKDSRGHAPDKIMGVRLSNRRRSEEEDEIERAKAARMKQSASDEELEYHNGYVQRKDSKKTRFATNVLFIEPLRRASSVSCLEGMNSRRGSAVPSGPPTVSAEASDADGSEPPKSLRKHIRFSDSVSVICDDIPLPKSVLSQKRAQFMQRSISLA